MKIIIKRLHLYYDIKLVRFGICIDIVLWYDDNAWCMFSTDLF